METRSSNTIKGMRSMATILPACKLKDGIDDKQYRDDTDDFFLTACSLAGAHEWEWQVDDCSGTTDATNTISAMTQAVIVAIAKFVENANKMVMPSVQHEQQSSHRRRSSMMI